MGCSFSNIHAFVGSDDELVQRRVADAIQGDARVSPPHNGWVSAYPENRKWYDGAQLSLRLSMPVVTFRAEDSDIAAAKLYVGGALITMMVSTNSARRDDQGEIVGLREYLQELEEDPNARSTEYYDFYIDALTWPRPLTGLILTGKEVCIHAEVWISVLGRSSVSAIRTAANDAVDWPFPEHIIGRVLETFGLEREQSGSSFAGAGKLIRSR